MDPTPARRSNSRNRLPPLSPISHPTTPLRPSSRSSLRTSQNNAYHTSSQSGDFPLDALESQFAELTDSMADLEANFMHLQLMHESLSRFGESFASFLYGLNMRAFCVDFPEAPVADSIKGFNKQQQRYRDQQEMSTLSSRQGTDTGTGEMTFMSMDPSFVDSASMRATPKRSGPVTPAPLSSRSSVPPSTRGYLPVRGGRGGFGRGATGARADAGAGRGGRGSGMARPGGRGIR